MFLADGVSLNVQKSFQEKGDILFLQCMLHYTTTVLNCDSPSPGPAWSDQIAYHKRLSLSDSMIPILKSLSVARKWEWSAKDPENVSFMILGWAEDVGTARCAAL